MAYRLASAERGGVLDPVGNVVCGARRQIQANRRAADGGHGLRDEFVTVAADFRRHATPVIYGTVRLIERDDESFLAWATQPWACPPPQPEPVTCCRRNFPGSTLTSALE